LVGAKPMGEHSQYTRGALALPMGLAIPNTHVVLGPR